MPRERRTYNRSVVATDMDFVDKSATAVNFLMFIYGENVNALADIVTARADGDKEVLINYLGEVKYVSDGLYPRLVGGW